MDDIGTEPTHVLDDVTQPGKCPLHIGIEEERHTGGAMYFRPVGLALGKSVAGGVNPDLVAPLLKRLGESKQSHPYAAYHWPVDLGKKGNAHRIRLRHGPVGDKVGARPWPVTHGLP